MSISSTNIKKIARRALSLAPLAAVLPFVVEAASSQTFKGLAGVVVGYLNMLLALLMGIAILMFVIYIIRYFVLPYDKRVEAAKYLMWSLIGFFAVLSMWGLVNILVGTFSLGQGSPNSWTDVKNLFP